MSKECLHDITYSKSVKQVRKLIELSYTTFIMLLYRVSLDRLCVHSKIILLLVLLLNKLNVAMYTNTQHSVDSSYTTKKSLMM